MIFAQADHAANVAQRVGELGQMIVAVAGPADSPIFIDIFRAFGTRHPSVRIALRNMRLVQLFLKTVRDVTQARSARVLRLKRFARSTSPAPARSGRRDS